MMKKLIPLLLLALLLTACSGQTVESSTQSPGPEPTQTTPSASTGSGLVAAEEPPILDWMADQPVPGFLDEEQRDLFLRAYSAANFLMGCSTGNVEEYPLADGTMPQRGEYEKLTLDNGWTYLVAQGRYARWADFKAMLDSVFTPEYQEELLYQEDGDGERIPVFTETPDGGMCFIQADRGSDTEYDWADMPDTYELVSMSDDAVEFSLIGHYAVLGEDGGEIAVQGIITREYPIRMERTADGWRVAEFHLPY
ncbi:hypothetical protein WMO64_10590 [Pseudoflavonifractor sp. CLA-AP-H29]|uniref:Uncharacterized protein n=1 Tax=Pseudoflavonifractor intestinihominis TaxID=3133171 RepID=A0ABV1EAL6_9FIRM